MIHKHVAPPRDRANRREPAQREVHVERRARDLARVIGRVDARPVSEPFECACEIVCEVPIAPALGDLLRRHGGGDREVDRRRLRCAPRARRACRATPSGPRAYPTCDAQHGFNAAFQIDSDAHGRAAAQRLERGRVPLGLRAPVRGVRAFALDRGAQPVELRAQTRRAGARCRRARQKSSMSPSVSSQSRQVGAGLPWREARATRASGPGREVARSRCGVSGTPIEADDVVGAAHPHDLPLERARGVVGARGDDHVAERGLDRLSRDAATRKIAIPRPGSSSTTTARYARSSKP